MYTLNETLNDSVALAYFIQFMEGIGNDFISEYKVLQNMLVQNVV